MHEKQLRPNVLKRIMLMKDGELDTEVVGRMSSDGYRRKILLQMLDQRFTITELDPTLVDLKKLDEMIISIIKRDFKVGNLMPSKKEIYKLYIDLCCNQFLLNKALDAIKLKPARVIKLALSA